MAKDTQVSRKHAKTAVFSRNGGNCIINHPCHVTRPGVPAIVTPRRRVVMGGRHEIINGRRVYHINTRWLCEWPTTHTNGHGITRIVMLFDYFSEYELEAVADMELLEAA